MGGTQGEVWLCNVTLGRSRGPEPLLPGCFGKGSVHIAPVCLEHLCGFYYCLCSWNYVFFLLIEIKTVVVVLLLVFNFQVLVNKSAWASPGRFGDTSWPSDSKVGTVTTVQQGQMAAK